MSRPFNVLLANFDNWRGVARLPGLLYQAGCRVHVVAPERNHVSHSGHIEELYPAPETLPDFLHVLRSYVERSLIKFDWIITADEPLLIALAEKSGEPWAANCMPVETRSDVLNFLLNKSTFLMQAKKLAIPVPSFVVCRSTEEAIAAASALGYPVMLKRITGFAGAAVWKADGPHELRSLCDKYSVARGDIIVQECLEGDTGGVTALFDHGRLVSWMSFLKARTHPGPFGPTCTVRPIYLPEIEPILFRLGGYTGFHGLSGLDFIRGPGGKLKVIEMHPRPTPQPYLAVRAGVDFADAINAMLSGKQPEPPMRQNPECTKLFPMFPQDVHRALTDRDFGRVLKWLVYVPWWRDIMWNEPSLLFWNLSLISWHLNNLVRDSMSRLLRHFKHKLGH